MSPDFQVRLVAGRTLRRYELSNFHAIASSIVARILVLSLELVSVTIFHNVLSNIYKPIMI